MSIDLAVGAYVAYATVLIGIAAGKEVLARELCRIIDAVLRPLLLFATGACAGGWAAKSGMLAQGAASYAITDGPLDNDGFILGKISEAADARIGPAIWVLVATVLLLATNHAIRGVASLSERLTKGKRQVQDGDD